MAGPLHLIVGVDFGYTHTGVAFSTLEAGQLSEPEVVHCWPSKENEVVNKVATRISYKTGQSGCTGWGFKVRRKSTKRTIVEEYFKLYLDKNLLKSKRDADSGVESDCDDESDDDDDDASKPRYDEVQKWFVDFFSALYEWVQHTLKQKYPSFQSSNTIVEYIFSVPTTWDNAVVAEFQNIFTKAGFGSVEGHTAIAGLTEAEAAAVYTAVYDAKEQENQTAVTLHKFQEGDVLMVCDAGGGTTDVSLLKVTAIKDRIPQLDQQCPVQGDAIGSVLIDEAFEQLVKGRLKFVDHLKGADRSRYAKEMAKGDFQRVKVHFGEQSVHLLSIIRIKVPGLDSKFNHTKAGIRRGEMEFALSDIEKLFDDRIEGILRLIDNQLQTLQDEHPNDKLKYLVLSGGLGSSQYLQQSLEEHYIHRKRFSNAQNTKILVANDPQLVVCRGLVLQRIQENFKISVINGRCCRASYGIVYDVPWDKTIHSKKERHKNREDGNYYVERIHWLILKNQFVVDDAPPKKTFTRSVSYKSADKWIHHKIVRFDGIKNRPEMPDEDKVEKECAVECNLGKAIRAQSQAKRLEHVEKDRRTFLGAKIGGRFFRVEYDIRVYVGPANLKFDLVFDGKSRSGSGDLRVEWDREYRLVAESVEDDDDEDE